MKGPENFDSNNVPDISNISPENEPITKDSVVEILRLKGPQNDEAYEILEKFTKEKEEQFQKEGRKDARMESLRERAHALRLADCFDYAIAAMHIVAEIAENEGDNESYDEANWIIFEKLLPLARAQKAKQENSVKITSETIEKTDSEKQTEKQKAIEETRIQLEVLGEKIPREKVVDAYKKFSSAGDPANLDDTNPDVAVANHLYNVWNLQRKEEIKGDMDAELRQNFEETMLFVDAGFQDKSYLGDVLHDWLLANDVGDVSKDENNPERIQLRKDMAKAILQIKALLRL